MAYHAINAFKTAGNKRLEKGVEYALTYGVVYHRSMAPLR